MKLIYIEWCDAFEASDTWMSLDNAKDWGNTENWIVKEVGFIIDETKEYLLFANRWSNDNAYAGVMKIPKTWIRKRIDLTKHIK